jgi:hypothetical protein
MHDIVVALVVVAIVGYVIGRQLVGEPQRGRRLIVLPAVLTVIGAVDLHSSQRPVRPVDVACLVVGGLIAAGIGLAQGRIMRLESRDGSLWAQLPLKGLWLWAGLVVSRVAMIAVAVGAHAHVASSSSAALLMLGINRLSQAAVVAPRAVAAGIPFAPEKDGEPFLGAMLAGRHDDR